MRLRLRTLNSIEYSLLLGSSIWRSKGSYYKLIPECSGCRPGSRLKNARCRAFLDSNKKARAQWNHEGDLAAFEKRYAKRVLGTKLHAFTLSDLRSPELPHAPSILCSPVSTPRWSGRSWRPCRRGIARRPIWSSWTLSHGLPRARRHLQRARSGGGHPPGAGEVSAGAGHGLLLHARQKNMTIGERLLSGPALLSQQPAPASGH